jgi:nitrile hydratase accessory protein
LARDALPAFERMTSLRRVLPDQVVFTEPWQAHAFAMAVALAERGSIRWEEFRQLLIREIAATADDSGRVTSYYEAWLRALETALRVKSIVTPVEIEHRVETIAANSPEPTRAVSTGPVRIA